MEVRQLEAFTAVAAELHFGHAAERLGIGQSAVSELVRRLERELGAPLFTRTTRRVALTAAGAELLPRAAAILDEIAAAAAAVRQVADGEAGTVRLGITPPAASVLAPHLCSAFAARAPAVTVSVRRMWLGALSHAVASGAVDVALTCGVPPGADGVASAMYAAEPALVGLRPGHRLAGQDRIELAELADEVLGVARESLFPAWAASQRQILESAGVRPRTVELEDTDLAAVRWLSQPDVDWILLIGSLAHGHTNTVLRPAAPEVLVPFTIQWSPARTGQGAVARFVEMALTGDPPPGYLRRPAW
ncbi:MAG: LysR family transcriptional regulator [Streptosporangiaceae bacterium]